VITILLVYQSARWPINLLTMNSGVCMRKGLPFFCGAKCRLLAQSGHSAGAEEDKRWRQRHRIERAYRRANTSAVLRHSGNDGYARRKEPKSISKASLRERHLACLFCGKQTRCTIRQNSIVCRVLLEDSIFSDIHCLSTSLVRARVTTCGGLWDAHPRCYRQSV
jgi:hypothetical protein